jgi:hypothetical protein
LSRQEHPYTRSKSLKTNFKTYRNLLEELCSRKTRFITDIEFAARGCSKCEIFLRHDVDFTLEGVLALAQLEASFGVTSTYYFLVSDIPGYNIFDSQFRECVACLQEKGHGVGVHVNLRNGIDIAHISSEIGLFMQSSGLRPSSFTVHNPTLLDMRSVPEAVEGILNVSHPHRFKGCPYSSDSNGIPKGFILDITGGIIRKSDISGCLLTHPIWWVHSRNISPREKVIWALLMKLRRDLSGYDMLLRDNGRINSKRGVAACALSCLFRFIDMYYS